MPIPWLRYVRLWHTTHTHTHTHTPHHVFFIHSSVDGHLDCFHNWLLKKAVSLSFLKYTFDEYRILNFQFFSSMNSEFARPLYFSFHCFWLEVSYCFIRVFFVNDKSFFFPSCFFQDFLLDFDFQHFYHAVLIIWTSLNLFYFTSTQVHLFYWV